MQGPSCQFQSSTLDFWLTVLFFIPSWKCCMKYNISIILISFYVHGKPACHTATVDISGLAFDSALPRSVHRQLVIHYWQMDARFLLPSSLRWVEAVKVCSIKMLVKELAWGPISHWLYISMNGKPSELEDQRGKWSACVWRKIQSPDVKPDELHNTEDPGGQGNR